jgi:hypothetical protein
MPINIEKLVGALSDAIVRSMESLRSAHEIKRLCVHGNVLDKLLKLNRDCFIDNEVNLFVI